METVQRLSGLKDPLKTAILTGFLLCDDLKKAGSAGAGNGESGELEQLTLGMISRLEEALNAPNTETALTDTTPGAEEEPPEEGEPEAAPAPADEPEAGIFFKLQNTVKNYEWGSPEWIPALVGQKNMSRIPWAELWMGVHPAGPSRIIMPDGNGPLLSELIDSDPETFLGKETISIRPKRRDIFS